MTTTTLSGPIDTLAYRGDGTGRPGEVTVPTADAPVLKGRTLRKHWRFVGIWDATISICAASVKVGPLSHEFWAVRLPDTGQLVERARLTSGRVDTRGERLRVRDGRVEIDVELIPFRDSAMEVVSPVGSAWTWTRKTARRAVGHVVVDGVRRWIDAPAMVEDNGGYHPRRTAWRWAAGAGTLVDGRSVMWNAVVGLNDRPPHHENTVWVDGVPRQTGLVDISGDLRTTQFDSGERLSFHCDAERAQRTNLVLLRSDYRAPLGRFSGSLPGGLRLAEGHGVMEDHRALW
jgi:hypothetical protein